MDKIGRSGSSRISLNSMILSPGIAKEIDKRIDNSDNRENEKGSFFLF
jgi:hypothetical protein